MSHWYVLVFVGWIKAVGRINRAMADMTLRVFYPPYHSKQRQTPYVCVDLGFSNEDRHENIRRIGEMTKLFMEVGVIVLTSFISPYRADRERVRGMVEHGDCIEIYCDTPLEICEARDVKGSHKKARAGQIPEFTGISSHLMRFPKILNSLCLLAQQSWIPEYNKS